MRRENAKGKKGKGHIHNSTKWAFNQCLMNKEEKVMRKETIVSIWSVTIQYLDLWYENLSQTDWPGFMRIQGPFSFIWYHLHHMANLWSPLRSESEQQDTQLRCQCLLCSFGGIFPKYVGWMSRLDTSWQQQVQEKGSGESKQPILGEFLSSACNAGVASASVRSVFPRMAGRHLQIKHKQFL